MSFDPRHGEPVELGGGIVRIVAPNSGPFTGTGTNTYLLGTRRVMIVDPGPDRPEHVAAVVAAVAGRDVSHILITHTHRDHVGALGALHARVGGERVAQGPHRLSRPLKPGEVNPFADAGDTTFRPDRTLADGERLGNGEVALTAIATPGHCANHMVFALGDDLLSGDHVMGWSTSVVAPPDGSMGAYIASLDKLTAHPSRRYLPGHGDVILEPLATVSAMRSHRLIRERAIRERLAGGDRTIAQIVAALYAGIDPRLAMAAGLSVQAHLERLEDEGRAASEGVGPEATWRPA